MKLSFRRASAEPEEEPDPLKEATWLYSYADLVTQLLLFTVLTVTVAGVKDKFEPMPEDLPEPTEAPAQAKASEALEDTARKLDTLVETMDLGGKMAVDRSGDKLIVRLESFLLFGQGSAELMPEAKRVLDQIVTLLAEVEREVRVEGHTDDVPISSARYPSNWELSSDRAISVVRHLEQRGIHRGRLSAAGYGRFRPIAANTSRDGRALNRRVEIVILGE